MNLPLRSALGTSKFSFTSVWTGDELARGPAPNSASPVMSRDSFLLLEPHFRSLLTLSSPHRAFLPTAVILKCPLSGVLRSMSGSLLMPQSMLRSSFLSVPSRLTCTLLSSRKLGLSHLFFQVIVVVRDLPLERVWVVVNLLSVMVKSPLPSFLPFQVISRSLPLPVLAILNPLNLAPAWFTFTERIHNVQLDVGEGGECVEDEGGQVLHALDVLPHERDALPFFHHVLVQVRLYGGRISIHVPQLISAVDDESFTVKVLRTRAIQSGTFPQAGVVVTSGHLACYFAIGD